ncbi:hypothetical protein DPMN_064319 [Dreissena polymorpha]|uniref:Uncharacterized protein n=1 Tax=Dreissena polymorpha TaxID=45954 RepID=A0A9D4CD53_DREPO|nr:hypothetical protein DPMN_064319 [Dreissena polymorpha]
MSEDHSSQPHEAPTSCAASTATVTTTATSSHTVSEDHSPQPHEASTSCTASTATSSSPSSPEVCLTGFPQLPRCWVRLQRLPEVPTRPAVPEDDGKGRSKAPTNSTTATATAPSNRPSSPDVKRRKQWELMEENKPRHEMEEAAKDLDTILSDAKESLEDPEEDPVTIPPTSKLDDPSLGLIWPLARKTFITEAETKEMEEVFSADIKWAAENGKTSPSRPLNKTGGSLAAPVGPKGPRENP